MYNLVGSGVKVFKEWKRKSELNIEIQKLVGVHGRWRDKLPTNKC